MPTYYAITSPPGQGGISVIEIFGPDACRSIRKITRPAPALKVNRFYLGHIYASGKSSSKIDQVVIRYTPAGRSFTGLDTVEINAHGGVMAAKKIAKTIAGLGVKQISAEKLISRYWRLDGIQKDALRELLRAGTPLAAKVLLSQFRSALSMAITGLKRNKPGQHKRIIDSARLGLALTRPKKIVIIGKPNAGKSTLFNALVGKDRALVHPQPGTTRDSIEELIAIKGVPFRVVDTAGLRKRSGGLIERTGIGIAREEMAQADLILLVMDATKALTSADRAMIRKVLSPKTIIVYNKIDLKVGLPIINQSRHSAGFRCGSTIRNQQLYISALKSIGINRLKQRILQSFGITSADLNYKAGTPVIFSQALLNTVKAKKR